MRFDRSDLEDSRHQYEVSGSAEFAAIGSNFRIEENVSDLRRTRFETTNPDTGDLLALSEEYFRTSVQGTRRGRLSSTFDPRLNGHMLLPSTIEPNQKLVRLERIDDVMSKKPDRCAYGALVKALDATPRDDARLQEFVELFETYPGERPAFVAFKAELADVLSEPDWLEYMILRLGLYHNIPEKAGVTYHFALMEYMVGDVLAAARRLRVDRPFAVATVVDGRPNPAFFPVPNGTPNGFAVDLGVDAGGPMRELLHVRMDYVHSHVVRFGSLIGPRPKPDLPSVRDRHVGILCRETGRSDFGEPVTVGV